MGSDGADTATPVTTPKALFHLLAGLVDNAWEERGERRGTEEMSEAAKKVDAGDANKEVE